MRSLLSKSPVDANGGRATGRKFGGDYPSDVTAGIEFVAEAVPYSHGVHLVFGEGVGRFSRDTPRYKKGGPRREPAGTRMPALFGPGSTRYHRASRVRVTLHIPEGREVGQQTLNPRVGVEGGISVLGTTGLVEPWDDHLTESMAERVAAADHPVLTTGRVGLRYARLLFPGRDVILIGGKIGEALAASRGKVVLCGLPALILRYISPGILDGTVQQPWRNSRRPRALQRLLKRPLRASGGSVQMSGSYWWTGTVRLSGRVHEDYRCRLRPGMLTEQAIKELRRARTVFGSERAIGLARAYLPEGCMIRSIDDYKNLGKLHTDAVLLSTGDPMLAGSGTSPGR